MHTREITAEHVTVRLTRHELVIVGNALNEVCNGLELPEFSARMGADHDEVAEILNQLHGQLTLMDRQREAVPDESDDGPPPGQHPCDSCTPDIDQVAYALTRLQVMLQWIDEHRTSFEKIRNADPDGAEGELRNLDDATGQAVLHLQRLTELIRAGYAIDPTKQLPQGFCNASWMRSVEILRRQRGRK